MVEVTYAYNANQVLEVRVATYGRRSEVSIARNANVVGRDLETAEANLSEIKVL
jgi:molecular chaperone DnaK